MVDLAGSELGKKEANKQSNMAANVSVVHSEALFGIILFHAWVKNRIPLWLRFRVFIVKHPSEQEEVGDEKVCFYADEHVQLQDVVEGLKEEIEVLSRQRLDAEGHLAELQSEVVVLRTQDENLTLVDKKRNVEELVNAKK